jgi:hypothetical protein
VRLDAEWTEGTEYRDTLAFLDLNGVYATKRGLVTSY